MRNMNGDKTRALRLGLTAWIAIIALISISITGLSYAGTQMSGPKASIDREISEIQSKVEGIRGIRADKQIPCNFMSEEDLKEKLITDLNEDRDPEEEENTEKIMRMLKLIDDDMNLYDFYVDLYSEQVAGFYDPEENEMYLITEDGDSISELDRVTIAHEIVHYLQNLEFDLNRPPFKSPEEGEEEVDDDALFAATCLVEGDAMRAQDEFLFMHGDMKRFMEDISDMKETPVYDSAPHYIKEALLFPYTQGKAFVDYLYKKGGQDRIDAAFRDPPVSTEQIMHPEKYDSREMPIQVELIDFNAVLGEDWEIREENTLGEFDVKTILETAISKKKASNAAEGWGGNRYALIRSGEEKYILFQSYAWDSYGDATDFEAAYLEFIESAYDVSEIDESQGWRTASCENYFFGLGGEESNSLIIQSEDEEALQSLMAAISVEDKRFLEKPEMTGRVASEAANGDGLGAAEIVFIILLSLGSLIMLLGVVFLFINRKRRPPKPAMPYGVPPNAGAYSDGTSQQIDHNIYRGNMPFGAGPVPGPPSGPYQQDLSAPYPQHKPPHHTSPYPQHPNYGSSGQFGQFGGYYPPPIPKPPTPSAQTQKVSSGFSGSEKDLNEEEDMHNRPEYKNPKAEPSVQSKSDDMQKGNSNPEASGKNNLSEEEEEN